MRPQTFISTQSQAPTTSAPGGWGTLFIAAPALRGDHRKAHLIRSLAEHDAILGGRVPYSELRDQLEAFFNAGGKQAYVARVTNSPVNASVPVVDGTTATLVTVTAKSPGEYGNDYDMVTTNVVGTGASSTATWTLRDGDGNDVETFTGTAAAAAAHEWREVDLVQGAGSGTIVAGSYPLASGAGGHALVDIDDYAAVLPQFVREYGTGVVVTPMLDVTAAGPMLEAHSEEYNRTWVAHTVDSASAAALEAQGVAARAAGYDHGLVVAGRVRIPATAENPTSLRTISPVGPVAGNIASVDDLGSPARAAAGITNGVLRGVLEPTQTFNDADLDRLHNAGINVIRFVRGTLCLYDYVTTAPQTGAGSEWLNYGQRRAHAALLAELDKIAELYQFQLINGSSVLEEFHASITATLMGFHANKTLYGESAEDAYRVNVAGVNTPETIQARELHASLAVKYSETNFWTYIEVTKVPVAGTL